MNNTSELSITEDLIIERLNNLQTKRDKFKFIQELAKSSKVDFNIIFKEHNKISPVELNSLIFHIHDNNTLFEPLTNMLKKHLSDPSTKKQYSSSILDCFLNFFMQLSFNSNDNINYRELTISFIDKFDDNLPLLLEYSVQLKFILATEYILNKKPDLANHFVSRSDNGFGYMINHVVHQDNLDLFKLFIKHNAEYDFSLLMDECLTFKKYEIAKYLLSLENDRSIIN